MQTRTQIIELPSLMRGALIAFQKSDGHNYYIHTYNCLSLAHSPRSNDALGNKLEMPLIKRFLGTI